MILYDLQFAADAKVGTSLAGQLRPATPIGVSAEKGEARVASVAVHESACGTKRT
jgi:hypothetical protein